MDELLIKCEQCEYRWIGDDFDEDCVHHVKAKISKLLGETLVFQSLF
ncbi:hypothetical protein P9D26_19940 [Bacillus velezensis]|nr:hypothetical protein [Bacillus velezensis]MEC1395582.1 hypothetical protein [Bacillus velezensis]